MLCGGRAQYGPLSRLSVPHLALSSLPYAYHPARFCWRIVAFFSGILVAFLSCPLVRFSLLLVAAARNSIIDRNSEPPTAVCRRARSWLRATWWAASRRWDGVRLEVECPPDRESTTGGGSADRRVPALRAAEHTRAPRGGEGPLAQPRIPSKGAARGNDRQALGQGPPPDSDDRPRRYPYGQRPLPGRVHPLRGVG